VLTTPTNLTELTMTTDFDNVMRELGHLSAAEEFLDYFGIPYLVATVRVNRLHILKRFQQYLGAMPELRDADAAAVRETCKALLAQAYEDFVLSSPLKERVFKVLQDADGQRVGLNQLRSTLPSQRQTP
jgi:nitrogenase-stabilizing/protective protein